MGPVDPFSAVNPHLGMSRLVKAMSRHPSQPRPATKPRLLAADRRMDAETRFREAGQMQKEAQPATRGSTRCMASSIAFCSSPPPGRAAWQTWLESGFQAVSGRLTRGHLFGCRQSEVRGSGECGSAGILPSPKT